MDGYAVLVHEDRRFQPGGELRHRGGPLRRPAAGPSLQPCSGDHADADSWADGHVLPPDAADASAGRCWVWARDGRQQPVHAGTEPAAAGCHAASGVGRGVSGVMPGRTCLEKLPWQGVLL